MSKRSDQVFQLSLTEIAFTLAFILLLLLGYLVMRETANRRAAEKRLEQLESLAEAERSLNRAADELRLRLEDAQAPNPDEVISKLIADAQISVERDRLLVRVRDLESQISALAEVKELLSGESGRQVLDERIATALATQAEVERALNDADDAMREVVDILETGGAAGAADQGAPSRGGLQRSSEEQRDPSTLARRAVSEEVRRSFEISSAVDRTLRQLGAESLPLRDEGEAVAELVRKAESVRGLERVGTGIEDVLKENSDLRGQMANIRARLGGIGRGLDHPPCWADESGRIEYLFTVELMPASVAVTPAWPNRRSSDAMALPGLERMLASPLNYENFRVLARPIFDLSKRQDPECRHFVIIKNSIDSRREADEARWTVEEFFYKLEARR